MDQTSLPQHHQRTALLVGTDEVLLYTRKAILEKEGFKVSIDDPVTAIADVGSSRFSVVVVCHTLDSREADALVKAARANPARQALIGFSKELVPAPTAYPFDGSVWSLALPEAFVSKVHDLLQSGKP